MHLFSLTLCSQHLSVFLPKMSRNKLKFLFFDVTLIDKVCCITAIFEYIKIPVSKRHSWISFQFSMTPSSIEQTWFLACLSPNYKKILSYNKFTWQVLVLLDSKTKHLFILCPAWLNTKHSHVCSPWYGLCDMCRVDRKT